MKGFLSIVTAVACCLVPVTSAQVEIVDREAVAIPDGQPAVRPLRFADLHELRPLNDRIVSDIALGDVDGDGDLDAFYAHGAGFYFPIRERNGLQLNDGTGRFQGADHRLPLEYELTYAARLDDLEGDGDLDLLVLDEGLGVRAYLNEGRATFTEAPGILPALDDFGFELADVDDDGDLDLYLITGEQDRLFVNDGSPFFAEESFRLPADPQPTGTVSFGDVDDDGDLDALLGGPTTIEARLYLNDGSGVFAHGKGRLPKDVAQPFHLVDVDGDDDLDAFSSAALYLNDGDGFFNDASSQLPPLTFSTSILPIDVEGDGDVDALGNWLLYLNDGHGKFTNERDRLPDYWRPRAVGDVDGDGDADVFSAYWGIDFGNRLISANELYLGDGTGSFVHVDPLTDEIPLRPDAHRGPAKCAVLVDMDGDGDLDAVTGAPLDEPGGSWEQKSFLFTNDGFGNFADKSDRLPWIRGLVRDVAVADFDGDGDLDVARAESSNWDGGGGSLNFHWNHGAAGFDDVWCDYDGPPYLWQDASALDVGDVDHDGDVDILLGHDAGAYPIVDRLLLNDGDGTWTIAPGLPENGRVTREVRLVDVDGDSHLDALLVGGEAHLYLNDGAAVFTEAPLPFEDGLTLDVADVDGDDDVDILLAVGMGFLNPDEVKLYRNDGSGAFAEDPQTFEVGANQVGAVALQDVDEDGFPEAFVSYGPAPRFQPSAWPGSTFFRNDGAGAFHHEDSALPRGFTVYGKSFGDVDGDGDVDLLSTGRIWTNLTRQVSWATLPRIGQPLEMSVHGPPSTPFVLAFAPNLAVLQDAREGVHLYDPNLLVVVASGQLDVRGTASVVKDVPDDLALAGKSYFWQAMVGDPLRFTNVEWTTLLDL